MAINMNIKGTTVPSFQIGKQGVTIYSGTTPPGTGSFTNGDIYFQTGVNSQIHQFTASGWVQTPTASSNIQDISNLVLENNTFLGSDGNNIISLTATQAQTSLGLGTAAYVDTGTAWGNVPVLNSSGKLDASLLPPIAISDVYVVADVAARNALTVHTGDIAIVTSTNYTYIYDGSAWQTLSIPNTVASVAGKTGIVTLSAADITSGVLSAQIGGTGVSTYNKGDILVGNATNSLNALSIGTDGQILQVSSGTAAWHTLSASIVSFASTTPRITSAYVQDALVELANDFSKTWVTTTNPSYANDGVDTASIGEIFNVGDGWINKTTKQYFFCISNAANSAVWAAATSAGMTGLISDTSPKLGGDLDINGHSIVSSNNANITLTPNGTGQIILNGQYWPTSKGLLNQLLTTDASGNLSWTTLSVPTYTLASVGTATDGADITTTPSGTALQVKRLLAGNNITLTPSTNSIKIDSVNPTPITVGTGSSIYSGQNGSFLNFRSLTSGANINLVQNTNDVNISVSGLATVATSGKSSDLTNDANYLTANQTITVSGDATGSGTTAVTLTLATVNTHTTAVGSSNTVPVITANGKGLVTNITTATITPSSIGAVDVTKLGVANGLATLDSSGKLLLTQLPASISSGLNYLGTWDASANDPALVSGTGTKGDMYKVYVSGTTTLDGVSIWNVNDLLIFDGISWDKIDGVSSEVLSVAGKTGTVTLSVTDITGAAPLVSPIFTTPTLTANPANNDNSLAIATTAYVQNQNYLTTNSPITLSGDISGSGSTSIAATIAANSVSNTKLALMPANTIKGNNTSSSANASDLTMTQVVGMLPAFGASGSSHSAGLVPDPGSTAGTTRYLREDGTWQTVSGGGGGSGSSISSGTTSVTANASSVVVAVNGSTTSTFNSDGSVGIGGTSANAIISPDPTYDITINGGAGTTASTNGGHVWINGGTASGTGSNGNVYVNNSIYGNIYMGNIVNTAATVGLTVKTNALVLATTGTSYTITLPQGSTLTLGVGTMITIKDASGGAGSNTLSIAPYAGDTIEISSTPKTINTAWGRMTLVWSGTTWLIIG